MYTLEEIEQALEELQLSEALIRLEQVATSHGLSELARWAKTELEGYFYIGSTLRVPSYRLLRLRRAAPQTAAVVSSAPEGIPFGVRALEIAAKKGLLLRPPRGRIVFQITPDQIETLLSKVRAEARRRTAQAFPQKPAARPSYASPGFTTIVQDPQLATILERRWTEANNDFQSGSYLSTIFMLGSILEGAILDKVLNNPAQAGQAKTAPKDSTGKVLSFDAWTLASLIEVAHECSWLSKAMKDFSIILRDYRNYIHPRQQLKHNAYYPEDKDCKVSWEVTIGALDDLK